jgi:energy-coupling factor transporter ATP-binding protein EcfA2
LLGVSHAGEIVNLPWPKLGHLLVAGKTGSGKSVFLRLLVYQAIAEGAQLLLVDLDGATFPMLANHPALVAPVATSSQTAQEAVERALGECEHRAMLYQQMGGFPENLEEYNVLAIRQQIELPPRLLIVLDEFSTLMTTLGGPKSAFANQVTELGWRGRKFGINVVFAAQDFTKQVIGRVRDQVNAVVCFRVRSMEAARAVGCPEAVHISESRPGLACTDRWGPVQTFYLDKRLLARVGTQSMLSEFDFQLAQRALSEAEGKMSIPLLVSWGIPERRARALVEAWELRGWLRQDPARQNARYITSKFQDLMSSSQNCQTGSNRSS